MPFWLNARLLYAIFATTDDDICAMLPCHMNALRFHMPGAVLLVFATLEVSFSPLFHMFSPRRFAISIFNDDIFRHFFMMFSAC